VCERYFVYSCSHAPAWERMRQRWYAFSRWSMGTRDIIKEATKTMQGEKLSGEMQDVLFHSQKPGVNAAS